MKHTTILLFHEYPYRESNPDLTTENRPYSPLYDRGLCSFVGGGTGIRTLGTCRCYSFQDCSLRPLAHPAIFSLTLSAPSRNRTRDPPIKSRLL